MLWTLPPALEDALWDAVRAVVPAPALDPRVLAAAIEARMHRYTDERAQISAPLPVSERARDLAARALFFTVADAAKIQIPLAELANRGLLPAHDPLRILDVGAGAGAMTLGALATLPARTQPPIVTAIDQDRDALAILARAVATFSSISPTIRAEALAPASVTAEYDLIFAGTVLNELPEPARQPLVHALLDALAPDGALLIIEPALRDTTRALHALRDALLADVGPRRAHVFAPCTRRASRCPALDDPRDWCHEDRPFAPPPRLRALIQRTRLRADGLKFSYLTLRRASDPLVLAPGALRVVSHPLDQKGTIERMICGDEGRTRLRLLRRDRTDENHGLHDSRRGDVLVVSGHSITRVDPTG